MTELIAYELEHVCVRRERFNGALTARHDQRIEQEARFILERDVSLNVDTVSGLHRPDSRGGESRDCSSSEQRRVNILDDLANRAIRNEDDHLLACDGAITRSRQE